MLHPPLELLYAALGELERLDPVLAAEAGLHDAAVPVCTVTLLPSGPTQHGRGVVVPEAEVVTNGMCEVTGQDVRLEWIHINVNSYRSFCANSSHAGSCRLSTFERVPPSENKSNHLSSQITLTMGPALLLASFDLPSGETILIR